MMTYKALFLLLLLNAGLSGCSAWATYPPIPGALQIGRPEVEPVPTIMAEAIRYSNERYVQAEEPTFNLPENTPAHVYDSVKLRLRGGKALRDPGEPAVHIKEVRVRANEAQVDVIFPRNDGWYQLVTLYLHQRFMHKYAVRDTRLWRVHVQAPPPHYPVEIIEQEQHPVEETVADADTEQLDEPANSDDTAATVANEG